MYIYIYCTSKPITVRSTIDSSPDMSWFGESHVNCLLKGCLGCFWRPLKKTRDPGDPDKPLSTALRCFVFGCTRDTTYAIEEGVVGSDGNDGVSNGEKSKPTPFFPPVPPTNHSEIFAYFQYIDDKVMDAGLSLRPWTHRDSLWIFLKLSKWVCICFFKHRGHYLWKLIYVYHLYNLNNIDVQ